MYDRNKIRVALLILSAICVLAGFWLLTDAVVEAQTPYDSLQDIQTHLGTFDTFTIMTEVSNPDGSNSKIWQIVDNSELGYQYVPIDFVTKPDGTTSTTDCNRPVMLQMNPPATTHCVPNSIVGRIAGTNPEVQWVFIFRKYVNQQPTDLANFNQSGDVAIIGHHPRTGATVFFQYYRPNNPIAADIIPSPWSGNVGFWMPQSEVLGNGCNSCHGADAFIHSPWIQQATMPNGESVVPTAALQPYFFIGSDAGQPLSAWHITNNVFNIAGNACTSCHRITADTAYSSHADFVKWSAGEGSMPNQSPVHRWMPPFQSGTGDFDPPVTFDGHDYTHWNSIYEAAYTKIMDCYANNNANGCNVQQAPHPPDNQRLIVVPRDHNEAPTAGTGQYYVVVDTRMRMNADAVIKSVNYYGNNVDARIAQVALVGTDWYISAMSEPFSASEKASQNLSQSMSVNTGDYIGLVLEVQNGQGGIPYSVDDWAKVVSPSGFINYANGAATYFTNLTSLPDLSNGAVPIYFENQDFRTYSIEVSTQSVIQ